MGGSRPDQSYGIRMRPADLLLSELDLLGVSLGSQFKCAISGTLIHPPRIPAPTGEVAPGKLNAFLV